jgi:hypothetical protein
MASGKGRQRQAEDDLFDWFTITYRSIWIAVGILVALAGVGFYVLYLRNNPGTAPPAEPVAAPTTAQFTSIEGSVKVKAVGTIEWVNADRNTVLRKSDLVRTGPGAAAEITFFDGTVVQVRPDSLITIEETSEDPSTKARRVAWHVSSGDVYFQTTRKNVPESETTVTTPTIKGQIDEMSHAAIRVGDNGDSDVRLFQGSGRMQTKAGQTVELGASEAIKVDAGGRAGTKVNLPGIPTLLAPPHQAEITYRDPSRETTLLVWKPVLGAVSYHLMLDYSAYFNRPLLDRSGITGNQQQLIGLDVGKYYWRVAAVNKDGEQGNFSDYAGFTVSRPSSRPGGDGPPPPLVIDAMDVRTNILQIKGRTEPGATITVNGQRVDVDPEGGFNDFITLEKAGRQLVVIRATGLNGGVSEQRRPVVVSY